MRSLKSRPRYACLESLESRQLFAATVVQAPVPVNGPSGTSKNIDLTAFIDDPTLNTQVRFSTNLGDIDIELFDQQKPVSVTNFLNYVRQERYDGTIVHRLTKGDTDGIDVVQGGGFPPFIPTSASSTPEHIAVDDPIANEASVGTLISNTRGTIAMARTSDPDNATSEWFINTGDNSVLDPGPDAGDAGYAVFGGVVNNTIGVADAIHELPTFQLGGALQATPLQNFTGQVAPTADNYITLNARTLPTKLTFTAETNNPAVATPVIDGNRMVLSFGPTVGVANITIHGTNLQNNTVTTTLTVITQPPVAPEFNVTLGGPGNPTSVAFTDADGTAGTISLKGAGTAVVTFEGDGLTQATAGKKATVSGAPTGVGGIVISDVDLTTAITIAAKGGNGTIDLSGLTADAGIKSISAKPVNFTGSLNVAGPLTKLDIGNTTNATIVLGGSAASKPLTITMGAAVSTVVRSTTPMKSLTATSFAAGSGANSQIQTPILGKLTVAGDLGNSVFVSGAAKSISIGGSLTANISADTIGSLTVKGDVTDVSINAIHAFAAKEKPLGKVTVGGAITGALIRAAGNITSVTAGSLSRSLVVSGLVSTLNGATLPTSLADFANPTTLGSVTIKGTYANSNVIAANLGKVSLGTLTTANGGAAFGLGADKIASITGAIGDVPKFTVKKLATPADVDAVVGDTDLGDFNIAVV